MHAISEVVHQTSPHRIYRGDASMKEQQYAMTRKYGKATVHVVAPPPITDAEYEQIVYEHHLAGWAIWNSLTDEEKSNINNRGEVK